MVEVVINLVDIFHELFPVRITRGNITHFPSEGMKNAPYGPDLVRCEIYRARCRCLIVARICIHIYKFSPYHVTLLQYLSLIHI